MGDELKLSYAVTGPGLIMLIALGCAQPSADAVGELQPYLEGPVAYEEAWRERPDAQDRREQVQQMLDEPVDMDTAVRVALLNNPRLQVDLVQIDITEAMVRQDAVIANPRVDSELYFSEQTEGVARFEAGLQISLTSLFSRASRVMAASAGVDVARAQAAGRVVNFISEVRRAWVDDVAARQLLAHQEVLLQAARADAQTAQIYHDAGNIADDELYQALTFSAEARQDFFRAEEAVLETQDRLRRLLAIDVEVDWTVIEELPEPPEQLPELETLEEQALQRSLVLRQVEHRRDEQAAQIAASRWQGWLPDLTVGVVTDWRGGTLEYGPAAGVALPLFDRNQYDRDAVRARGLQQDWIQQDEINRIRLAGERVSRQLHLNHQAVRQYRDEILILHERLVEETLRQYNAMNVGIFELLQARRNHLHAQADHIDARRRFWMAYIDFNHLLGGGTSEEVANASGRH